MSKAGQMVAGQMDKTYQRVVFGGEAHQELLKGATILANAVKATMGPSGHNVILDNPMSAPMITKDGVTVARAINLREKLPSIGAELLKEVASKTNEQAGDGTTTATVLGHTMLSQGIKMIATGRSAIGIKRGMDLASAGVIDWLKKNAIAVRGREDIISVGTISANGDREIGELLADAIDRVGQDGIITIEPAKSVETTLEVVEGMQFESGFISPYFITNQEKLTAELNNPLVLITNKKLSALSEILPLLEMVAKQQRPLLIIGDEVDGEVLHTLIVNKIKGVLSCCAVKTAGYGEQRTEILSDIALVTGGTVLDASSATALKNVTLEQLGSCNRIIVSKAGTTIVGDGSEEIRGLIDARVLELRKALDGATMDERKRHYTRQRLAKLAGGVAVVRVGGSTEVEILEKKDRVEDALNATVAAAKEGIIPGGGCALFYAARDVEIAFKEFAINAGEDEKAGWQVIFEACREPLRTIVKNTGKSPDVVMDKLTTMANYIGETEDPTDFQKDLLPNLAVERFRYGYDAAKHEYCDLVDRGIIDPVMVARYALEHASSVIGLILSCSACVVNEDDSSSEDE